MAHEDQVKNQVRALIERKVQGEEIVAAAPEEPKAQIIDLMEALKKSLGEKETPKPTRKRGAKKTRARKSPKPSPAAKKKTATKKRKSAKR